MKKSFKLLIPFLLIFSILVFPNDGSAAYSKIDSSKITQKNTTLKGKVSGDTKICLRAGGSSWLYSPVVSIYTGGSLVKTKQIKPGECIAFNAGKSATRTYSVLVSRLSVPGTFYFDLYS